MKKISLSEILELSAAERIELVTTISDGIEEVPAPTELTQEQKEELDRRMEDFRKDPASGIPWEEVRAKINLGLILT